MQSKPQRLPLLSGDQMQCHLVAKRLGRAMRMGLAVAVALSVFATASRASTADDPFADIITIAARRYDIPEPWIRKIIQAESAGDVHATSPKGAVGLMQIMPQTYADLRHQYGLGDDPYGPRNNILAGAAYLRELFDRYGANGFLAAYNAGPARYDDYLTNGRELPEETLRYLRQFGMDARDGLFAVTPATDRTLFVKLGNHGSTDGSSAAGSLFVAIRGIGP